MREDENDDCVCDRAIPGSTYHEIEEMRVKCSCQWSQQFTVYLYFDALSIIHALYNAFFIPILVPASSKFQFVNLITDSKTNEDLNNKSFRPLMD